MYRPLPDCLTIKNSEIEGLGLFAKEDIPKGTNLGTTHVFGFFGKMMRTPLGGFYNHSEDSNCEKLEVRSYWLRRHYELVTTRDIKSGEEITVNYTLYKLD